MNFTNLFSNINSKEVIKNLPDAVFVIDADGKVVWVNDKTCIIFEAKADDLKGLQFDELVSNGLTLAEKSHSRRNSVVTGAFTIEGKDFYIEMNAKRYIDQYFITIRDITAMTNVLTAAEKTGRLNKEKNVMISKLSNEFKSPIQSIIGFSQALLDGLGGEINDKQSKYVKIINKNSNELLYFFEKFLTFSKAESSLFSCENKPFDLVNLVQEVVRDNEVILNEKNLMVEYYFDEFNKKVVSSDEGLIKTILQNVLEVSIRLTDAGSISVKLTNPDLVEVQKSGARTDADEYVKITISDTGVGLSAAEMEGIFEPYTQLDKSNKKSILRSLTLGVAYTLTRRMGGAIWIDSEVMKGAVFSVILPVAKI